VWFDTLESFAALLVPQHSEHVSAPAFGACERAFALARVAACSYMHVHVRACTSMCISMPADATVPGCVSLLMSLPCFQPLLTLLLLQVRAESRVPTQ
jgi:hypothetical protein